MGFMLRGMACVPVCTFLGDVRVMLVGVEGAILLINLSLRFDQTEYILPEAVAVFLSVAVMQSNLLWKYYKVVENVRNEAF